MEYSLSNAYTQIFKSKGWAIKLTFMFLLNLPTAYLLISCVTLNVNFKSFGIYFLFLVALITLFINLGYCAAYAKNLIYLDHNDADILPKWSGHFLDYFSLGIKKFQFYYESRFTMLLSSKDISLQNAGIEIAIEALFCKTLNQRNANINPMLNSMLNSMRENNALYNKMIFINALESLACAILCIILYKLNARVESYIVIITLYLSYYCLTSSYFAYIAAKHMD